MTGTTSKGWPHVTPADHPLEYPAFSQQFAEFASDTVKINHAVKAADQAGIASGGSAGVTATLTGLRVGQLVVGLISTVYKPTTGAVPSTGYVNPAASGLTAITAPIPPFGFTAINSTWNGLSVVTYTAAAATASLGYSMTFSSNATWTCQSQSSVTLIAL